MEPLSFLSPHMIISVSIPSLESLYEKVHSFFILHGQFQVFKVTKNYKCTGVSNDIEYSSLDSQYSLDFDLSNTHSLSPAVFSLV